MLCLILHLVLFSIRISRFTLVSFALRLSIVSLMLVSKKSKVASIFMVKESKICMCIFDKVLLKLKAIFLV